MVKTGQKICGLIECICGFRFQQKLSSQALYHTNRGLWFQKSQPCANERFNSERHSEFWTFHRRSLNPQYRWWNIEGCHELKFWYGLSQTSCNLTTDFWFSESPLIHVDSLKRLPIHSDYDVYDGKITLLSISLHHSHMLQLHCGDSHQTYAQIRVILLVLCNPSYHLKIPSVKVSYTKATQNHQIQNLTIMNARLQMVLPSETTFWFAVWRPWACSVWPFIILYFSRRTEGLSPSSRPYRIIHVRLKTCPAGGQGHSATLLPPSVRFTITYC